MDILSLFFLYQLSVNHVMQHANNAHPIINIVVQIASLIRSLFWVLVFRNAIQILLDQMKIVLAAHQTVPLALMKINVKVV